MAHPSRLLTELEEKLPNLEVRHWVYGFLTDPSRRQTVKGEKGILVASDDYLICFTHAEEEEGLSRFPLQDLRKVTATLDGAARIVCKTGEGSIELSYISRGDVTGMVSYLKTHCNTDSDV